MRRVLLVCCLIVLTCCVMWGQTNTGSITGEVRDTTNAVVPGVDVAIVNVATGQTAHAVSSDAGVYSVSALQPGGYKVTLSKQGFATSIIEVEVFTATTSSASAILKVGGNAEQVTIVGDAPVISSESATINTTIDNNTLQDIPVPERSTLSLVLMAPGIQGDPQYSGGVQSENPGIFTQPVTPGGSLQMGGGRPGSGSILVDGSDISLSAYPRTGVTFSGNTVQEVTVQQNGLPAQYGRTGGGIINQSTRGGGNDYHGSFSWQHTEPFLQAATYGNPNPPLRHQNMFAGAFGGPVRIPGVYDGHNKTFFYVTVEPLRVSDRTYQRGVLPTPDELQGKFNNSVSLLDPNILRNQGYAAALAAPRIGSLYYQYATNLNGFPTGSKLSSGSFTKVPNNDLSAQLGANPTAQFLFGLLPNPNKTSNYYQYYSPDGAFANDGTNAYLARGVTNSDNRYSIRFDHALSESDQLKFRYTAVPVSGNRYNVLGPDSPAVEVPDDTINSQNATLSYSHFFRSGSVNEFRTTYVRGNRERTPIGPALSQDWGAAMGLMPATNGLGFPQLSGLMTNWGIGSGGATTDGGRSVDQNFGLADDFSFVRGAHTIKIGADIRMLQLNRSDSSYLTGGYYNFNAADTNSGSVGGNSMASFILGIVHSYQTKYQGQPFYYRWKYYAGYVQDDWKLRHNVTLNLGVRYNLEMPRKEKYNNQGSFDPNVTGTLNGLPVTGGFVFSGSNGRPETLWPVNYLGFEPRVGVAWAPSQRMTVRSSYAMVHVPLTGLGNNVLPDLSLANVNVGGSKGGTNPSEYVNYITNPICPYHGADVDSTKPCFLQAAPATSGSGPLFTYNMGNLPYVSQSNAIPYVQLWSFSMQFQVSKLSIVEVGYSGQKGTHLFGVPVDKNAPALSTLESLAGQGQNFTNSNIVNPYFSTPTVVFKETLQQALRPYQQFYNNAITSAYDRDADSHYHSLYVTGRTRVKKILTLMGNFTWSKSIDNASSGSTDFNWTDSFGFTHPQLPYSDQGERSLSTFDIPARFTAGYKLDLPIGHGHAFAPTNKFLSAVLGDWKTSGITTVQSGAPLWVVLSTDTAKNGYFCSTPTTGSSAGTACANGWYVQDAYVRPNIVPGVPLINPNWRQDPFGTQGIGYLNPAAFSVPGSKNDPQLGNAPRTMGDARNPRVVQYDMSFSKQIPTGSERFQVEVRGDFINAFNHQTFFLSKNAHTLTGAFNPNGYPVASGSTPDGTQAWPVATTFGLLTAGSPRTIRLGVKATF